MIICLGFVNETWKYAILNFLVALRFVGGLVNGCRYAKEMETKEEHRRFSC